MFLFLKFWAREPWSMAIAQTAAGIVILEVMFDYLIAVIFLLFDIEAAFFLPWALIYRDSLAQGGELLVAMGIFLFFFG